MIKRNVNHKYKKMYKSEYLLTTRKESTTNYWFQMVLHGRQVKHRFQGPVCAHGDGLGDKNSNCRSDRVGNHIYSPLLKQKPI